MPKLKKKRDFYYKIWPNFSILNAFIIAIIPNNIIVSRYGYQCGLVPSQNSLAIFSNCPPKVIKDMRQVKSLVILFLRHKSLVI